MAGVAEDHYRTLGVAPGAGADEVRAAYLRRMREHHPDRRPGDPDAARTARAVNVAYAVLRDQDRRRAYDAGRQATGLAATARVVAPARTLAYSEHRAATRRAVSATVLRLAAVVLVVGLAVLFTLPAS